jgi:hypothetical protein
MSVKNFYYMTIILSNCMYGGSAFLSDNAMFDLETIIRNSMEAVTDLEFRGVGCSMVRGSTNSLTLGISAGYFNRKQNLINDESNLLRTKIRNALTNIQGLVFSELRIETVITGRKHV